MNPLRTGAWALTPEAYRAAVARADLVTLDAIQEHDRLRAARAADGKVLPGAERVRLCDGVAVLPIVGTMTARDDFWTWFFGGTSYEQITDDLRAALASPARAILLDFDTPGGDVVGLGETADVIRSIRGVKPIVGYVRGSATSAGQWLASACDEIVIAETGLAGSVGVVSIYTDTSKLDEKIGIEEIEIVSSGAPDKRARPTTPRGRALVQQRVDAMETVFRASLDRNRPGKMPRDFGKGGVFVGAEAVRLGFADRLGSFDSTLAALAGRQSTPYRPALSASEKKTMKTCSGCGGEMAADDPAYCKDCYDEEAKALGLAAGASSRERRERAQALARFAEQALTITGGASLDEAIGRVRGAAAATAELAVIRAAQDKADKDARATTWRELLAAASIGEGARLLPADLHKLVPTFLDEPNATTVKAALDAIPVETITEQTTASLLGALGAITPTAGEIARLRGYLAVASPRLPAHAVEPAGSLGVTLSDERLAKIAADAGVTIEYARTHLALKPAASPAK